MSKDNNTLTNKILQIVSMNDQDTATDNANKDSQLFSTQRDLIAGCVAKHIAEEQIIPKHLVESHKSGRIHIHDMDYFPLMGYTNCCLVNLKDMLTNGFKMNGVKIEQPKGIQTAMTLASQIVMAVGSSQYGGISFNRIDEVLAPYVHKTYDKWLQIAYDSGISSPDEFAKSRTRKDVYDACQTFEYQVNSMTCTSGQTPFLTIGFGLGTSLGAKLLQEMILKIRTEGIGADKITAIFPKLIFTLKDGLNLKPEDPNYYIKQRALKCSAKRMYPDIVNYEKVVEVTGSFKASMGCRSFLSDWQDESGNSVHSGRPNLGVTTLSLPMVALDSGGCFDRFWELLDERLSECKQVCEMRLDILSKTKAKQAPILYTEGGLLRVDPEEYILPHLLAKKASISIGYLGINEMANAMYPDQPHIFDSEIKQKFSLDVLEYMNNYCNTLKDDTGVGYSLYGTPSERQCYRLSECAKDVHGIVTGVTDKEYFTNSFHLEAGKQSDVYSRILFEQQFVPLSSGGFICYGELPDMKRNLEALENIWDFSYNYIPYYAVNCPSDKCLSCGYEGELLMKSKGFICPTCKESDQGKLYAVRRVSGYLGSPAQRPFNKGKTEEVKDRIKNIDTL